MISSMAKSMLENEQRASNLSKAYCRYLYSNLGISHIAETLGITGEEIRLFILSRGAELRVRFNDE